MRASVGVYIAMFNVQFNAGRTRGVLRQAAAALEGSGAEPMYEDIADYMHRVTEQRFQKGEAPDGTKWAPKSLTTIENYKRRGHGYHPRPLIFTGALAGTIQRFVSRDGVVIGSSRKYANVMQDGASKGAFGTDRRGRPIPWGRIPARQWLGISKEDELAIIEIAEEHLGKSLTSES